MIILVFLSIDLSVIYSIDVDFGKIRENVLLLNSNFKVTGIFVSVFYAQNPLEEGWQKHCIGVPYCSKKQL